jgi:hypothetical protein
VEALEKRELLATALAAPLHFEFGTRLSAVAPGYTGVTVDTAYSDTVGYGWQNVTGLAANNRPTGQTLTSSFVKATDATFLVNVANGTYNITPTLGDAVQPRDQMGLYAQGQLLASGLATNPGQFITPTYQVQVDNGQLNVRFVDSGGVTPRFALNALDITQASTSSPSKFAISHGGIYALGKADSPTPLAIYSNPYIDGIAIRASWYLIETGDGVYNWSYLDSEVQAAANAGKQVSLRITAGVETPNWVYSAGAQGFTFQDKTGQMAKIPVPWDSVYLTKWEGFIQALGKRYGSNPAVVSVKLTGINTDSGETNLPYSPTDIVNWQKIGYTRTKVENAWNSIVDTWAAAFPSQQLTMMLTPVGFPPIDSNGNTFSSLHNADSQIVTDMTNYGIATYGSRFALQNNGLSDYWICPQVASQAAALTTGYEMLWYVTNDPSYRMNNGTAVNIRTALQNAMNSALAAHAQFLDIYIPDVTNPYLQSVLANAHAALAQNALPTAPITGLPASGHSPEGTAINLSVGSVADPSTTNPADFTYAWAVTKDGQAYATGSGVNFTFTPDDDGTYAVSLQVTDSLGRRSLVNTQTITVDPVAPTATITGPSTGKAGSLFSFTGGATDPSSVDMAAGFTYNWDFGNGMTRQGQTAGITYAKPGTYTVTLTLRDADATKTVVTTTVTVTA